MADRSGVRGSGLGNMACVAGDYSEPDDTLQARGGEALARLAGNRADPAEAEELVARLRARDWEGDDVLSEDLAAAVRGVARLGKRLPVALDELAGQLEGDPLQEPGLLDLRTGEVVPGSMTDPGMVGEDAEVDVEADPDRWLRLPGAEARPGWRDMALFAERTEPPLRDRLDRALRGRGAFRRFKDELARADALHAFHAFSDDRQRGRARQFHADEGILSFRRTPDALHQGEQVVRPGVLTAEAVDQE